MAQENTKILSAPKGSSKKKHRVGRGQGSGWGCTAGRGDKGAQSRAGYSRRAGFEGGQMPLQRRLPKRGFTNIWGTEYTVLNVDALNGFEAGTVVTPEMLKEAGLVKQVKDGIKILGDGKLEKNLTVQAHKFTKTAVEKIESAGGKVEVI